VEAVGAMQRELQVAGWVVMEDLEVVMGAEAKVEGMAQGQGKAVGLGMVVAQAVEM
jgi:hypothetical protein